MSNHQNHGPRGPSSNPTSEEIKSKRESLGLTQTNAAALIYKTLRAWQDWEGGQRRMDPAFWELFLLKTSAIKHA